eukprot:TRINITY_DN25472_c0_g1_i2.p2 TRINITY_DN25472_c0_g1~~TRINITY_DN25472_c0_g1_i2.p2  ORF type:complete len:334 (+),score=44.19 TRINITY_DN25472_c0_g1_i2:142-1143(+)
MRPTSAPARRTATGSLSASPQQQSKSKPAAMSRPSSAPLPGRSQSEGQLGPSLSSPSKAGRPRTLDARKLQTSSTPDMLGVPLGQSWYFSCELAGGLENQHRGSATPLLWLPGSGISRAQRAVPAATRRTATAAAKCGSPARPSSAPAAGRRAGPKAAAAARDSPGPVVPGQLDQLICGGGLTMQRGKGMVVVGVSPTKCKDIAGAEGNEEAAVVTEREQDEPAPEPGSDPPVVDGNPAERPGLDASGCVAASLDFAEHAERSQAVADCLKQGLPRGSSRASAAMRHSHSRGGLGLEIRGRALSTTGTAGVIRPQRFRATAPGGGAWAGSLRE